MRELISHWGVQDVDVRQRSGWLNTLMCKRLIGTGLSARLQRVISPEWFCPAGGSASSRHKLLQSMSACPNATKGVDLGKAVVCLQGLAGQIVAKSLSQTS